MAIFALSRSAIRDIGIYLLTFLVVYLLLCVTGHAASTTFTWLETLMLIVAVVSLTFLLYPTWRYRSLITWHTAILQRLIALDSQFILEPALFRHDGSVIQVRKQSWLGATIYEVCFIPEAIVLEAATSYDQDVAIVCEYNEIFTITSQIRHRQLLVRLQIRDGVVEPSLIAANQMNRRQQIRARLSPLMYLTAPEQCTLSDRLTTMTQFYST